MMAYFKDLEKESIYDTTETTALIPRPRQQLQSWKQRLFSIALIPRPRQQLKSWKQRLPSLSIQSFKERAHSFRLPSTALIPYFKDLEKEETTALIHRPRQKRLPSLSVQSFKERAHNFRQWFM
jgi:hypothetical protein